MNASELLNRLQDRSPEQWLAEASDRLPFWVCLLMAVLIAWYLARLTWTLYPPPGDIAWEPPPRAPAQTTAASESRDYSKLLTAQLFGKADAEPQPDPAALADQDALDAPDTRLDLTLRATVASTDSRQAHAIIADGSGEEKVYFLRDPIPGGATLQQVRVDRVILNRGGTLEALRLPREFDGAGTTPVASRRPARSTANAPTVQQVVEQNASNFTEIVRPQPYMPNGQLRGYRIYPGRNRQQFAALGLRPGDLVTGVNGIALTNPAEGMEIFRSLGNSSQVTLTLERNGEVQSMTLDTAQVAGVGEDTQ